MGLFDSLGLGDVLGFIGGERTNRANAKQAKAQMDFQERMSNTAHQREVKDLRAAGLNPILSATGGSGASSPPGAKADMVDSVASAMQARRQRAETRSLEVDAKNRDYRGVIWEKELASARLLHQQHETEMEKTRAEAAAARILEHQEKGARVEGNIDDSWEGELYRRLQRLNPLGSSARGLRDLFRQR